ncbi:MAG TPA: hypothetical protein VJG67_02925 [Candidatus Paceibacterota bacterium]
MAKARIEGRVAGFVLVALPGTDQEKRVPAQSLTEAMGKIKEMGLDKLPISNKPRATIYTVCQLADGTTEEQEGYDFMYKVGSYVYKVFCSGYPDPCENAVGWFSAYTSTQKHLCPTCGRAKWEDDNVDVDEYLDRLAEREEY